MRTTHDQLKEKGLTVSLSDAKSPPNNLVREKPKEKLSRKEWEEIMGVNRETYQKQGGAYRRRR